VLHHVFDVVVKTQTLGSNKMKDSNT